MMHIVCFAETIRLRQKHLSYIHYDSYYDQVIYLFQNSSGMHQVYKQCCKICFDISRKRLKGLSLVLAGS